MNWKDTNSKEITIGFIIACIFILTFLFIASLIY